MKLNEIKSEFKGHYITFKQVDFIGEAEGLMPFDISINYDYTSASYTRHPYGEGHADEHHGAEVVIHQLVTISTVQQLDKKDNVIRTWPVHTNVKKLPGWDDKHLEWFEQQIAERDH